ncbi:hypothetical protein KBC70_01310 [Candidatus Woesebacteria bacterium]|nr:hypothetical protein [Candidatus Woesebacteria bacterium]
MAIRAGVVSYPSFKSWLLDASGLTFQINYDADGDFRITKDNNKLTGQPIAFCINQDGKIITITMFTRSYDIHEEFWTRISEMFNFWLAQCWPSFDPDAEFVLTNEYSANAVPTSKDLEMRILK